MPKPYRPFEKKDFLSPDNVIEELNLEPGKIVIDFGCGSGFWTVPMAKKVGKDGLVVAIDPRIEKLEIVKSKILRSGLSNVKLLKAPFSSIEMPTKEIADVIIISNILSKINNDLSLIFSTRKNAKEGTILLIVDWNEKTHLGPKEVDRVDVETVISEARKAGFEFKKLINAGVHHFGLYFVHE